MRATQSEEASYVRTESGPFGEVKVETNGTIIAAEVEDLNADGFPEIYVYVSFCVR